MRYLILSDIHANLEALESTLSAAGQYDAVLVLGDLVGYGADPNAVIDHIRAMPGATIIRGNHDKVGSGLETVDSFNHLRRNDDLDLARRRRIEPGWRPCPQAPR